MNCEGEQIDTEIGAVSHEGGRLEKYGSYSSCGQSGLSAASGAGSKCPGCRGPTIPVMSVTPNHWLSTTRFSLHTRYFAFDVRRWVSSAVLRGRGLWDPYRTGSITRSLEQAVIALL